MLNFLITDYQERMDALSKLSPSGYAILLNWRLHKGPQYEIINVSPEWEKIYDRPHYIIGDPVAVWEHSMNLKLYQ